MLWVMNTQNGSFTTSSPTAWNLIDIYIGKLFISIFRQKEIAWWQSQVLPFKAQPAGYEDTTLLPYTWSGRTLEICSSQFPVLKIPNYYDLWSTVGTRFLLEVKWKRTQMTTEMYTCLQNHSAWPAFHSSLGEDYGLNLNSVYVTCRHHFLWYFSIGFRTLCNDVIEIRGLNMMSSW